MSCECSAATVVEARGKESDLPSQRRLLVIADDYGIGPNTSKAILELGRRHTVTGSVLLVNSPYAEEAVHQWRQARRPFEMGWHPNLTLDAPILPAKHLPSLTGPDGKFWSLGTFLRRLFLGRIKAAEVSAEFRAQLRRYVDLVGQIPSHVNSHQHVSIFAPVRRCLLDLLLEQKVVPYVRRVQEPWSMLWRVRGARKKRIFLNYVGRIASRELSQHQVPGNDWFAGITDPQWSRHATFFEHWLRHIPGQTVELMCHPGHADATLLGRDCFPGDGLLQRRVDEFALLSRPEFGQAVQQAGFCCVAPSQLLRDTLGHAA
jgi:chitin disaccharide deacetylase